ncbi:MAG: hypothetical protein EZS28_005272 [Streblomastix strix]|uniref:Integrase catalytic domain-containing protein n=1 Tax=Streblomastix strix TaxID=222440 RepID=A0A5J4WXC0_9EUKA|nr:MAG: hypothetical protein EZS28_005272 [Streblomastix strix]
MIPSLIKDVKIKPLSKLQRPYFSPRIGSWEIDIILVIPMKDKSSDQLKIALKKLLQQVYVNIIRGDGENGFRAKALKQLCDENHIMSYFTSSSFTQHNRIVDSVILTIRNGFEQDLISFTNPNKMQQMVQLSRDLEGNFIRQKQQQLELQLIKQQREQLLDFKSGNILMIHVDYSRTGIRFYKQRHQFNELATFITYKNGNLSKNEQNFEVDLKKYSSKEEAERVAAAQRQWAQQRYRIQQQDFRSQKKSMFKDQHFMDLELGSDFVQPYLDQDLEPVGNVYGPPIDLDKRHWEMISFHLFGPFTKRLVKIHQFA